MGPNNHGYVIRIMGLAKFQHFVIGFVSQWLHVMQSNFYHLRLSFPVLSRLARRQWVLLVQKVGGVFKCVTTKGGSSHQASTVTTQSREVTRSLASELLVFMTNEIVSIQVGELFSFVNHLIIASHHKGRNRRIQ